MNVDKLNDGKRRYLELRYRLLSILSIKTKQDLPSTISYVRMVFKITTIGSGCFDVFLSVVKSMNALTGSVRVKYGIFLFYFLNSKIKYYLNIRFIWCLLNVNVQN